MPLVYEAALSFTFSTGLDAFLRIELVFSIGDLDFLSVAFLVAMTFY